MSEVFTHHDPNLGFYDETDVALELNSHRVVARWFRGESFAEVIERLKVALTEKVKSDTVAALNAQPPPAPHDDDRLVTVCAACLCASCWQGKHMCQQSRDANVIKKPIRELRALGREHECYWTEACERGDA